MYQKSLVELKLGILCYFTKKLTIWRPNRLALLSSKFSITMFSKQNDEINTKRSAKYNTINDFQSPFIHFK